MDQLQESERRTGLPTWVPLWLPFTRTRGTATVTLVRFETTVRYRGDVHRHETVVWSAPGRPRPGAQYTVFASEAGGRLETDACAPNSQTAFDPDRYGLVARPPRPDPSPLEGWQGGLALALATLVLTTAAGAATALLRRSRRERWDRSQAG